MTVTTLELGEAAGLLGLRPAAVVRLALSDQLDAVEVDGVWLFDGASVAAWRPVGRAGRPLDPRLPAEPLLRLVDYYGGPAACGVRQGSAEEKALQRARRDGWVTERSADQLAIRVLGRLPFEVWDETA